MNISLESKDCVKYLGLLIDVNLSWKSRIDYVCTKISNTIGVIARLRYYVLRNTLSNLFQSLIQPYLNY